MYVYSLYNPVFILLKLLIT
jgi:NADH dehydrogenase (ubiquinone) 1 alpha subcomplex subunit 9